MIGAARGPVTSCLRTASPRAHARARLICFPHAGGTASAYRLWSLDAPWDIEVAAVQYPGHADRYGEEPATTMRALVAGLSSGLVRDMAASPSRATVLFGHSMGAAVAYETARALTAAGRAPRALIVSGRPAPHRTRGGTLHLASDAELLADLRRLGGTAAEVLAHEELLNAVLPTIRGDYRVIETYAPLPGRGLDVPVTVLRADADPEVDAAEADAWRTTTSAACDVLTFPGGHFYLEDRRETVLARVWDLVRAALPADSPAWPAMP
ncbi:thioesterase II family protein [Streptomyces sp. NPDC050548]|uniref:thioesterase II family protein n=1 Tax=Streptomyces sp. NPDC050548 TaxID=3365629 RepID=UPI0037B27740